MGQSRSDVFVKPKPYQRHRTTTYSCSIGDVPLVQDHHISQLCKAILNVSKASPDKSYTSVLLCGKSMSGKSTIAQTMAHRISCMSKQPYIIKWFSRNDLHIIDEIIDQLEKGLRYILIFDDVSFEMDLLDSAKRKKEIAKKLTYIRHDLGGHVITFMNIHYTTALMPMMRDADFKILTSMSDVDRKNWMEVFGAQNEWKLKTLQKQYASQMKHGYFYVNGVNADGKSYAYQTNAPFRIALVSEMEGTHTLLFPKEGCEKCAPVKSYTKKKIPAEQFFKKAMKGYKNSARTMIRYWAYYNMGWADCLPKNAKRAARQLKELEQQYGFDPEELKSVIKATIGNKEKT